MPTITILDLMDMLRGWFSGESWAAWRAVLKGLFALPMTDADLLVFHRLSGRTVPPGERVREAWLIFGRRAGKSIIAALLALWAAVFRRYRLAPGERGLVLVVATDRRQARVVFRYICAFFDRIPALAKLVERRTAEALHLTNGISIEVATASFRTLRGYTIVAFIGDEPAFWHSETSANPDAEILAAVRPAMATVPEALLLLISTPYARRGVVWQAYRQHWGRDGDAVLVLNADTRTLNPTVPEAVLAEAYERDAASAAAEYGARFRADLESFVPVEVIEAAIMPGRMGLPPISGAAYCAFVDPSGGGPDSMTLAIAHAEGTRVVLDLVAEVRARFSPEAAVAEFAGLLAQYGAPVVMGDRYGGEWPRERFASYGVAYEVCARAKSDLYRDLLPLLTSGDAELLDHPRLRQQLLGLERRVGRSGRDSIDHAPGAHDDVINAAAGALLLAREAGAGPVADVEPGPEERAQLREVARMLGGAPEPFGGWANLVDDGLDDDDRDYGRA